MKNPENSSPYLGALADIIHLSLREQVRVTANVRVSSATQALLDRATIKHFVDAVTRDLVLRIEAGVFGLEGTKRIVETKLVPADWWQAFKARWFPGWLKRRFKVCYTHIDVLVQEVRVCPHLNVPPDAHEHIVFVQGAPR